MTSTSQPSTASRFATKADALTEILSAALALVADDGYAGLSLRSLADRVGVSVRTVTHHFGDRSGLVRALIGYAAAADLAAASPWRARASRLAAQDRAGRAMIAEAALDDWTTTSRATALLFCELLRQPPEEHGAADALEAWAQARAAFWSDVAGPCAPGDLLAMYVLDEATFSLCLSNLSAYRALRRLCLSRLMTGVLARGAIAAGEAALFADLVADLAPPDSIVVGAATPRPRTKRDEIAAHAAAIIVEHGVDHLTHRAVAAAADVPSSTVVYQFGARDDLVIGALEAVIAKLHASIADSGLRGTPAMRERARETSRATTAVALGAIRYPKLAPHAADMRRRRGENVRVDALPIDFGQFSDAFDAITAQVFSICRSGAQLRRPGATLEVADVENACRRLMESSPV